MFTSRASGSGIDLGKLLVCLYLHYYIKMYDGRSVSITRGNKLCVLVVLGIRGNKNYRRVGFGIIFSYNVIVRENLCTNSV